MRVDPHTARDTTEGHPLLVVPVFTGATNVRVPGLGATLEGQARAAFDSGDPSGRLGHGHVLYGQDSDGPRRLLLLGAGDADAFDAETVRRFAGHAVRQAEDLAVERMLVHLTDPAGLGVERLAQSASEGASLAAWRFTELTREPSSEDQRKAPPDVVSLWIDGDAEAVEAGVAAGTAMAEGQNFARTLQSRPGNVATPSHLADEAERMAGEVGLDVRVLGPAEMRLERMGALLAVAQGSDQEPRLILLEHRGGPSDAPPLVLVGKGLTFDAGGISIKPAKGMESMKFDMSGGAAVLGALLAVARMDLAVNVVGVVPSSENLLGGSAMKPGDVVTTRAGKTVEVVNTDAEGRLILCDAFSYAVDTYRPAAMVDCATLTGAAVVGLGHHAAALLGTDDELVEELRAAGRTAGERCWPLPLWKEYRAQLDSETADMKNVGGRPAGSITAAWFLREFVGDIPWAHLDVAGTAYGDEPLPYQRKGGFGFPTRLLVEWVRGRTA